MHHELQVNNIGVGVGSVRKEVHALSHAVEYDRPIRCGKMVDYSPGEFSNEGIEG